MVIDMRLGSKRSDSSKVIPTFARAQLRSSRRCKRLTGIWFLRCETSRTSSTVLIYLDKICETSKLRSRRAPKHPWIEHRGKPTSPPEKQIFLSQPKPFPNQRTL